MNDIEPEKVAAGGGGLALALLGFLRWAFTSRMSELTASVAKMESALQALANNLNLMRTELAVLTNSQVTRAEYDMLRDRVTRLESDVANMQKQLQQGVVPP